MRTLSAPEIAALQRNPVPLAVLVEMDLSSPLNLNTASLDLTIGAVTYYGTRGLGKIDAMQDTPSEIRPLTFELTGVPTASIAAVLTEPVRGKAARIKLAIFDPDTYQILGAHVRWAGLLDVRTIDDGAGTATIKVTAEHAAVDLLRSAPTLYSDSEQRRLYSGDPSLQFMADQADMRIIWPASTWRT